MQFNSSNNSASIEDSKIIVPQQMKTIDRVYQYATTSTLASGGCYTGNNIDCSTYKNINGHVVSDKAGTLYFQQSDDGSTNWTTIQSVNVSAGTQTSIGGTSYYNGIKFDVSITSKFARAMYVNGNTSQTYFLLSVYSTPQ